MTLYQAQHGPLSQLRAEIAGYQAMLQVNELSAVGQKHLTELLAILRQREIR